MHRLEDLVKPTLVALMRGDRELGSLDETERRTLARWVAKTAIIDSYAIGAECPVDNSVLKWLAQNENDTPGRFAVLAYQIDLKGLDHFQCGVIRDLITGTKAFGNISVIAVPRVIFVCAFPMLGEPGYECRCMPHHCWPLWPGKKAWKLIDGKPLNADEGELETMIRAAESIELFQSLTK